MEDLLALNEDLAEDYLPPQPQIDPNPGSHGPLISIKEAPLSSNTTTQDKPKGKAPDELHVSTSPELAVDIHPLAIGQQTSPSSILIRTAPHKETKHNPLVDITNRLQTKITNMKHSAHGTRSSFRATQKENITTSGPNDGLQKPKGFLKPHFV